MLSNTANAIPPGALALILVACGLVAVAVAPVLTAPLHTRLARPGVVLDRIELLRIDAKPDLVAGSDQGPHEYLLRVLVRHREEVGGARTYVCNALPQVDIYVPDSKAVARTHMGWMDDAATPQEITPRQEEHWVPLATYLDDNIWFYPIRSEGRRGQHPGMLGKKVLRARVTIRSDNARKVSREYGAEVVEPLPGSYGLIYGPRD